MQPRSPTLRTHGHRVSHTSIGTAVAAHCLQRESVAQVQWVAHRDVGTQTCATGGDRAKVVHHDLGFEGVGLRQDDQYIGAAASVTLRKSGIGLHARHVA